MARFLPVLLTKKNFMNIFRFFRRRPLVILGMSGLLGLFAFATSDPFEMSKHMDIYGSVYKELNNQYVDELKPGQMMKAGIDGMLESLDPYTEYIPEEAIEDYRMSYVSAEYGGVGAVVFRRGDSIIVSEVYEGFSAAKAGVLPGDVIVDINGNKVKGRETEEVSQLMKGEKGTPVKMTVERYGEKQPLTLELRREEIKLDNVSYYGLINDSTGYIKLDKFLENSSKEVKDALITLKQKNIRQLVLDLRGNGGGILQEAVAIVNLFVPKGKKTVVQRGRRAESTADHFTREHPIDVNIPLVVLVDKNSASASEIVAGAIQDFDRGVIVGRPSYGKGLVQQTFRLPYNSMVKITVARYYTPSGRCVQILDYSHRNSDGSAVRRADSTFAAFKTEHGRTVYDGSGIHPDVKVNERKFAGIAQSIGGKLLYFDYATRYRSTHKSIAAAAQFKLSESEYKDFLAFIKDKSYDYTTKAEKDLEKFRASAEKEGSLSLVKSEYDNLAAKLKTEKQNDLQTYKNDVRELLENEIVSRYYFQTGRAELALRYDQDVTKAAQVLSDRKLYHSILKGEGQYMVIGKKEKSSEG